VAKAAAHHRIARGLRDALPARRARGPDVITKALLEAVAALPDNGADLIDKLTAIAEDRARPDNTRLVAMRYLVGVLAGHVIRADRL
jgi:hypothetical protein